MADVAALEKSGWYVNASSVEEFCPGINGVEDISKALLDIDLRHVGKSRVAESTFKSKSDDVNGPLVLQIQKLRNVCVPRESEDGLSSGSGARLLKLILTDGVQTINAVELESLPGLSLNVPPGSKLKLTGKVPVCSGHLLLSRINCKLLGGHVNSLVDGWKLKRSLASHSRDSGRCEGGPPLFVPFAERGKVGDRLTKKAVDGFKSLDVGAKKKEIDSEFEQQRKAVIEAALQEQQTQSSKSNITKQQQADRDIATLVDMGFAASDASSALQLAGGNLQMALNSLICNDQATGSAATNGRANGSVHGFSRVIDNADACGKGDLRSYGSGNRSSEPQRERDGFLRDREGPQQDRNGPRDGSQRDRDRSHRDRDGPRDGPQRDGDGPERDRGGHRGGPQRERDGPRDGPQRDRDGPRERDGQQRERGGGRDNRRGGRRGGHQDREEDEYCRPSAPATLFDFVTSKMPNSSQGPNTKNDSPQSLQTAESNHDTAADVIAAKTAPRQNSQPPPPPSQQQQQHAPVPSAPLPPRLQRKQRQFEEEKSMKYYKPMEYMRQTTFSHSGPGTSNSGAANTPVVVKSENVTNARPVHDIHSRGTVRNKTLWSESETGSTKNIDRPRGSKEADANGTSTVSGDVRKVRQDKTTGRSRESDRPARAHGERSVTWADDEGQLSSKAERTYTSGDLENSMSSVSLQGSGPNQSLEGGASSRHKTSDSRQGNQPLTGNGGRPWKVGDGCMAKYWQDKQYYKATIKSVNGEWCNVLFTDYGNTEKVPLGEISELTNHGIAWFGPPDGNAMAAAYHSSTASVSYPPTATPGQNVVYQPVAAPSATHGVYYTQPFVASPFQNAVFDPATGQSVIVQAQAPQGQPPAPTSAVPGILIQGPPPPQQMSMYAPQPQHYLSTEANADSRTGINSHQQQHHLQMQQLQFVHQTLRK